MTYSITIFESMYDNKTNKKLEFQDFSGVEATLYELSKKYAKSKQDRPLISMAKYEDGKTRANDNVVEWTSWCAVDVDSAQMIDVENELKLDHEFYYVCHSTASSTFEHPKFRLIIPLSRAVKSSEISHFWYALNKDIGNLVDKQTKDKSRMFYVPAQYEGANNFIFTKTGDVLNVDDVMGRHKFVEILSTSYMDKLPADLKAAILKNRKSKMGISDVRWSSYKDCPFINKKILDEFVSHANVDGSGRYAKLYSIMVSIATIAFANGYPIETRELVDLVKQIDMDTARRYQKRKLDVEASNAIKFAFQKRT